MALPSSGTLSIKGTAGATRSIACCVDGNITGDKTLRTLGDTAFGSGARPHAMSDFYGYNPTTDIDVCLVCYYNLGSDGSPNICRRVCLCFDPALSGSESVDVTLCYCLCNQSSTFMANSLSCARTCYDDNTLDTCTNSALNQVCNGTVTCTYDSGNGGAKICMRGCTSNVGPPELSCAISFVCIHSVSNEVGVNVTIGTGGLKRACAIAVCS
jgi:hypothetical protein